MKNMENEFLKLQQRNVRKHYTAGSNWFYLLLSLILFSKSILNKRARNHFLQKQAAGKNSFTRVVQPKRWRFVHSVASRAGVPGRLYPSRVSIAIPLTTPETCWKSMKITLSLDSKRNTCFLRVFVSSTPRQSTFTRIFHSIQSSTFSRKSSSRKTRIETGQEKSGSLSERTEIDF